MWFLVNSRLYKTVIKCNKYNICVCIICKIFIFLSLHLKLIVKTFYIRENSQIQEYKKYKCWERERENVFKNKIAKIALLSTVCVCVLFLKLIIMQD